MRMTAFYSNEPFYLDQQDFDYQLIDLSPYLRAIGDIYLFTTEERADQDPGLTRDIIEATNEGWRYALAHKEEMVELILAQWSQRKSRDALLYEAERTHDLIMPLPLPIGSVYGESIEEVARLVRRQTEIPDRGQLTGFLFDLDAAPARVVLTEAERAWLARNPEVRLGTDGGWTPYVKRLGNGEIGGVEPELIARINALTGANIQLVLGSWSEVVAQAEAGTLHGLAVSAAHPERAGRFLFTSSPYAVSRMIFVRAEQAAAWRSMEDLAGRRVALIKENLAERKLLARWPGIIPVEMASDQAIALALLQGEVDAAVSSLSRFRTIREEILPQLEIAFPVPDSQTPLLYSVGREHPELHSILNKALAAIGAAEIGAIVARWGATEQRAAPAIELTAEERAWLKAHPRLRYCFSPLWSPYDYLEEGEHRGLFKDYLDLFASRLGVTFEPLPTPQPADPPRGWQAALDAASQRKCDFLSGAVRVPEREGYLAFATPYFDATHVLIAPADRPFVRGIEAVLDQRLGVLPGSAMEALLRRAHPDLQLVPMGYDKAVEAMERREIYAFIVSLEHAVRWMNEEMRGYRIIAKLDIPYPISVAVRSDWPVLKTIFDKAAASLSQADHAAIQRRWSHYTLTQQVDYTLLWQLAAVALLLLGVTLFWNRKLARARAALQASHDELSRYFDQPLLGMLTATCDKSTVRANQRFCEMVGYTQEELRTLDWGRLTHPDDLAENQRYLDQALRGEIDNYQMEKRYLHKDGHVVQVHLAVNSVRDALGRPDSFIGMMLDISERKRLECQLQSSEQRLRAIIAAEPECIKILDGEGRLLEMNPAGLAMVEADSLDQVAGRPVLELIAPEFREAFADLHRGVMAGEVRQLEFQVAGLKGGRRWLETHAVRLADHGQPVHLAVTRDITPRKAIPRPS
jgi:PAS domain S-box-containing protein